MKTLVTLCALIVSAPNIFAQGSLTPPGAPAPTMKSLDQIEPRTPISSLPFTISNGGAYYLTKNVSVSSTDGVTINASGVTLDLNGFEISSTEASPAHSGIVIATNLRNIRISNGSIRGNVTLSGSTYSGTGFANGIQISGSGVAPMNVHVSDLSISGCLVYGINLGGGLVEGCNLSYIGGNGINADTVVHCYVFPCGGVGITANISATGCTAIVTSSSVAIQADMAIGCAGQTAPASGTGTITAQIARDCSAQANSGSAGDAILANTAENCNGFALGTGSGIHCSQSAINCYGTSSASGAGVAALSAQNCYGQASGSGTGLFADSATGCKGTSASSTGLAGKVANNCVGTSSTGTGMVVDNATNCLGSTTSNTGGGAGLLVSFTANNCLGQAAGSGTGLVADGALNCEGSSNTGAGLTFKTIGAMCHGSRSSPSGSSSVLGGGQAGPINLPP